MGKLKILTALLLAAALTACGDDSDVFYTTPYPLAPAPALPGTPGFRIDEDACGCRGRLLFVVVTDVSICLRRICVVGAGAR